MNLKKIGVLAISLIMAVVLLLSGLQIGLSRNDSRNSFRLIGGIPTIILGTVEASGTVDYVLTGSSDNTVVQTALNALPSSGGKLQFLGIGALASFGFTATVSRAINNVVIEGVGPSTYFTYDASHAIFSAGSQTGWTFQNLATDAGGITQASDTVLMNVTLGAIHYSLKTATSINANVIGNLTGTASSATSATTATNVSGGTVSATNVTDSALTNGKVPIAGTGGLLQDATTIPTGQLGSGTANSSTYLRGDNTWHTPAGGTGTGARSDTIVVASADATASEQAGADYVCTGTAGSGDDSTTVSTAATAAGSGTVRLLGANYYFNNTSPVVYNQGCTFIGSGGNGDSGSATNIVETKTGGGITLQQNTSTKAMTRVKGFRITTPSGFNSVALKVDANAIIQNVADIVADVTIVAYHSDVINDNTYAPDQTAGSVGFMVTANSSSGWKAIVFSTFRDVHVDGYYRGIYIYAHTTGGGTYINSNAFMNCSSEFGVYCLDMTTDTSSNTEIGSTSFYHLNLEPAIYTSTTISAIIMRGTADPAVHHTRFTDCDIWDWASKGAGHCIDLGANTKWTRYQGTYYSSGVHGAGSLTELDNGASDTFVYHGEE